MENTLWKAPRLLYELTVLTVGAVEPCYTQTAVRVHFISAVSSVLSRIRRAFIYVCGIKKSWSLQWHCSTVMVNKQFQSNHWLVEVRPVLTIRKLVRDDTGKPITTTTTTTTTTTVLYLHFLICLHFHWEISILYLW